MVVPDLAGQGVGRWLLEYAESQASAHIQEFALVTGACSGRNIDLYERAGYSVLPKSPDDTTLAHLRKRRRVDATTVAEHRRRL